MTICKELWMCSMLKTCQCLWLCFFHCNMIRFNIRNLNPRKCCAWNLSFLVIFLEILIVISTTGFFWSRNILDTGSIVLVAVWKSAQLGSLKSSFLLFSFSFFPSYFRFFVYFFLRFMADALETAFMQREQWERETGINQKSIGNRNSSSNSSNSSRRRKRSVSLERNVETLVVADQKMTEFYSNEDIETYILTVMNMVPHNQTASFLFEINV